MSRPVKVGDRVDADGLIGVVVFCADAREFSEAYPEAEWGYLDGVGIMTDRAGLVVVARDDTMRLLDE